METTAPAPTVASAAQRNAFTKAVHIRGFELVERVRYGVYRVHSATRVGVAHTVLGTDWYGRDHSCTCEAGAAGRPWCWHRAATVLARQQHAYRKARAAATQATQATRQATEQAPTVATRQATATLRVGGQEYSGQGATLLEAIGQARVVPRAA